MVHQQQLVEPLMKMVSTSFTIATVISLMMCCTVPAGPPRQFSAIAENSTSMNVSWSAPTTPNGVIIKYQLQCSGGGQVFNRTVMETTTTLSGLLPYTNYSCSITAHTHVGGGPAATTSVTTLQNGESNVDFNEFYMIFIIAPGSPPKVLRINVINSKNFSLSWEPPTKPNGVITEYQFQCSGENHVMFNHTVIGSQTTTTLSGLLPYTNYSCSITAHTSVGGGPAATINVTTLQDGELACFY